jgi:DNA-binding CsgD family transcriptional regulator
MGSNAVRNVVLVHGGFVDGSGWQGVYESLIRDGFRVSIVQNPTLSLEGDAEATKRIIDAQDGPVVLVGHSYGGAVITEAGAHPNVAALVYVCGFAPDKDESVNTLIAGFPADGPQPPILPPKDGFLFLDREKFHASFAADLPADLAAFMADSQVPWGVEALGGVITDPGWPSYRARTQLAQGTWLRRRRRNSESRAPLREAADAFTVLGSTWFADRARRELRASGEMVRPRRPEAWDQLTPQELQIAQLAADGLTNREIGERLYISHRTVGTHLYQLFPKLGVTSRTELRAVLEPAARDRAP